jgi:hypothetical protein
MRPTVRVACLCLLVPAPAAGAGGPSVAFIRLVDADTVIPFTPPVEVFFGGSTSGGFTAFLASGPGGYESVFHDNAASFTRLADTETPIPGGTGTFIDLGPPSLSHLRGAFRGRGIDGQDGVYVAFGGPDPTKVADRTTQSPNFQGPFAIFADPHVEWVPAVGSGTVVFRAQTEKFVAGIYAWASSGDVGTVLADTTMSIPGNPGAIFTSFSDPVIDGNVAAFVGASTLTGDVGVFAWAAPRGLQVIADRSTPVPGGTGTFTGFGSSFDLDVIAASDGNVAFRGDGAGGHQGVYAWIDGVLEVVADTDTPVPGGQGTFLYFFDEAPAIDGEDILFFGVDEANDAALYGRIDGTLMRIIGPGDVLDGGTIANVQTGPEALDDGVIAFRVLFTDSTTAIYRGLVATAPPAPADVDGDGVVGVEDVRSVVGAWGACPPPPDACPADVDGDGSVGMRDLLLVLAAWGPIGVGPPVNDDCGGAIDVGEGGIVPFSTLLATTSDAAPIPAGDGITEWAAFAGLDCDEGQGTAFENDVWFRYSPPPPPYEDFRQITYLTTVWACTLTDFDVRLAVYAQGASCLFLEPIACNDDAPGCGGGARVSFFDVAPAGEYYIRVGSRDPLGRGSGLLLIGSQPPGNGSGPTSAAHWYDPHEIPWLTEFSFIEPDPLDDTPSCGKGDYRDRWFSFVSPWSGPGQVSSHVADDGPTEIDVTTIAVFDRSGTMLGCAFASETEEVVLSVTWGLVPGQVYLLRAGAGEYEGNVLEEITVHPFEDHGPCGWAHSGPCFVANPGVPGCDQGACCNTVCAGDPYCCYVEWDELCATAANAVCDPDPEPPCANIPSVEPCFYPHDTPGCQDGSCCAEVCQIDPFCCDFQWDLACAVLAAGVCDPPPCGTVTDQSCFEDSLFPGCEDPACCGIVCSILPPCCDVDWSQPCVDIAEVLCDP